MAALELVRWIHFVGFTTWIAGIVGMGLLLRAGAPAKIAGRIADTGATLAIVSGIYRAVTGGFFAQPYIHIKLFFVVALIGVHGALRVRVRKNDGSSAGSMVVVAAILAAIVLLVIELRPFAR